MNNELYLDRRSRKGIYEDLQRILKSLQLFKEQNPETFNYLCQEAIASGDMTLGDAETALLVAINEVNNG